MHYCGIAENIGNASQGYLSGQLGYSSLTTSDHCFFVDVELWIADPRSPAVTVKRFKQYRRVSTQYERTARNDLGFVLASAITVIVLQPRLCIFSRS